jgi:hypothetical protein
MFAKFSKQERTAVFVIAAFNLPIEVCNKEAGEWSNLWSYHLLHKLADELDLPESNVDAYIPMVITDLPYCEMTWDRRQDYVVPYLGVLLDRKLPWMQLYAMYLVYLFEEGLIDGRGHVLLRNIAQALVIPLDDVMWVENLLIKFMVNQQATLDHARLIKKDKYRYAKIGAVALGAGAIIAFTGGLVRKIFSESYCVLLFCFTNLAIELQAAPAVAGALVLLGTSAATAATVAGSMMLMFGGTGAGLAGYKMIKRTRGLTDFEFVQYDEKVRFLPLLLF